MDNQMNRSVGHQDAELGFGDYIGVVKRHASLLFGIVAAVVLIGVAIAYRVPPIYSSTGVLLSEQPNVPDRVVRSTAASYPEDRVRIVTQRVLTNDNLDKIIANNKLYPDLSETPGVARSQLRGNISLSAEDPAILENIMGSNRAASAMAFSLSFSDPSPIMARDVTRDLVALYLDENQRARREQASETQRFLTQESERLEAEIAEREMELSAFKEKNAGGLPELANVNMQLLDRTQRDIDAVEQEIRSLRERQSLYSSELAQLSPQATIVNETGAAILSPQDRLKVLQRTYMQLSTVYSKDHPDVQKVRREMEALSAQTGLPAFDRETLQSELAARQDELSAARDRYSSDHPDVKRLERTVEALQSQLSTTPSRAGRTSSATPDNPLYIQKQVQLRATTSDLEAALQRRDSLRARLSQLEGHLTATPEVQREYSNLTRGYEQLLAQYNDVEQKLRQAETALNLETENSGERFTVLDSPGVPSRPSSPNRLAVLLLTLVVAGALGAAGVAIAERRDGTVRSLRDVTMFLEIPPLVAIPYVNNHADLRRRTRTRLIAATAVSVWAGLIVFLVSTPP
jgi:uncharacterized protein involved in exopolysaccharide biosynthesis